MSCVCVSICAHSHRHYAIPSISLQNDRHHQEPAHDADEGKDTSVEAALVNEAATASTLHAKLLKASKDIPALRDMLEKSVSRLERTVGNAEEVLEKARSTQPNVVDDDVATPGAGGKTARRHAVATKLIRSSPYLKD